jgi:steroid delta-isomerase-like uncharacterized protein
MAGNTDALRRMVVAFNELDYEGVAATLGDECEFVDVATGETSHGPAAIVQAFKRWKEGFPDMRISEVNLVSTENGAAGEFVGRGTQTGPLGDVPPTDKSIEVPFTLIAEVADGKILGLREYYDGLTVMAQLELLPEAS